MSSQPELVVSGPSPGSEENSSEGPDSTSNCQLNTVIVSRSSVIRATPGTESTSSQQPRSSVILAPSKFGSNVTSSAFRPCVPREANLFTSGPKPSSTNSSTSGSGDSPTPTASSVDPDQSSGKFKLRPSALRVASEAGAVTAASSSLTAHKTASSTSKPTNNEAVANVENKTFSFTPLVVSNNLLTSSSSVNPVNSTQPNGNGVSSSDSVKNVASPVNGTCSSQLSSSPVSSSSCGTGSAIVEEEVFVFGQNLQDRAIQPTTSEAEASGSDSKSYRAVGSASDRVNGAEGDENQDKDELGEDGSPQSTSRKRAYEAITGEEDESNVMQVYCKLYSWEADSSIWREKGKGFLKLNDRLKDDKLCSRLVMRTSGSLKVILNCSLVVGMKFVLTSDNHLRFTNIDGIYLVKGKEKDIEQINSAIEHRLREMSKRMKSSEEEGHSAKAALSTGGAHLAQRAKLPGDGQQLSEAASSSDSTDYKPSRSEEPTALDDLSN